MAVDKMHKLAECHPENGTITAAGKEDKRPVWTSKTEFFLSCLGYCVGLGNIWRFPYLCFENGGGAFLIPYLIALAIAGLPTFFLDLAFGQYSSLGSISVWRCVPFMRGLGYGQIFISCLVAIYYNVIIMYTVYYFFASFATVLPWVGCGHEWNTEFCSELATDCLRVGGVMTQDNTCKLLGSLSVAQLYSLNITSDGNGTFDLGNYTDPFKVERSIPSEEYWKRAVLQESASMNETGGIIWQLMLCLIFVWVLVFVCLIKGIKSTGKVVYFTALFPYICLLILLVRGVTLPGSGKGINFYINPKWQTLTKPKVWLDGVSQIFFSLGAGTSGPLTLGSYNKFHNNCFIDGVTLALLNSASSIFAGFVIFSVLGFVADQQGKAVGDVVSQGFGLAFVVYPEAVGKMPAAPIWSIIFFFMLITIGLDSQFVIIERATTGLIDEFPILRRHRLATTGAMCFVFCMIGLLCTTNAGAYWLAFFNGYGPSYSYMLFSLCETVALCYLYGIKRLKNDIRAMVGDYWVDSKVFMWFPIAWCVLCPITLTLTLVVGWIIRNDPEYNGPFPPWAMVIGWSFTFFAFIGIPVVWVNDLVKNKGTLRERLSIMITPQNNWGPAKPEDRQHAWDVHIQHGTTMGGMLHLLDSADNVKFPTVATDML
ncbi:sodium- and chloride-dependent neutral and basic amino acid transporter B(0+)-like isoform X1 [Asterias rubens]|uniref:sodium- and chloride-dependent neutral and basic amino acid transporter B(0+)-like isoform X1 n=2 Tax=Asterias rubens TaxID=7604 RepID=UPI001455D136|nr:sodium- and chloride-dependent neutral and basic amino acid transporter B(0+)-like isoform X1 [Asterias rubens]